MKRPPSRFYSAAAVKAYLLSCGLLGLIVSLILLGLGLAW